MLFLKSFFQVATFTHTATRLVPWFLAVMTIALGLGYTWVFGWAPPDDQQGSLVAILYLHVPCAWFATLFYALLGLFSGIYLIWRLPLSALLARGLATSGIAFTAVCLLTGSFWGINSWGTWWVWDARLTSVLVLFFLYVAYFLMSRAYGNLQRAQSTSSLVAIVGVINLPIIKWSVAWWNTLHQAPSLRPLGQSAMTQEFWVPLMICALGWLAYGMAVALMITLSHVRRRAHV